jgi:hypothetical protein
MSYEEEDTGHIATQVPALRMKTSRTRTEHIKNTQPNTERTHHTPVEQNTNR